MRKETRMFKPRRPDVVEEDVVREVCGTLGDVGISKSEQEVREIASDPGVRRAYTDMKRAEDPWEWALLLLLPPSLVSAVLGMSFLVGFLAGGAPKPVLGAALAMLAGGVAGITVSVVLALLVRARYPE